MNKLSDISGDDPIEKFAGEYAFLSNFFPAPFTWNGKVWPTSEHAFQAAKTDDPETQEIIRLKDTPGKAKRAGGRRGIVKDLRPDWNRVRVDIMFEVVEAKFQQNPDLMKRLVETGDRDLIEGNVWNDTFWGVCRGNGKNFLGKILQIIRQENAG